MWDDMPPNVYVHDPSFAYPDADFTHMVTSEKIRDYVYDESFPYRLKDGKSKCIRFLLRLGIFCLVKPLCYIRYGLHIRGKENLRAYKKLAKGKKMLSVCNHTTQWDILFVMTSRPLHFAEFPMWQEGAECKGGDLYRQVGGLVVPSKSVRGMNYAYDAMKEVLEEGKWLHVFPEAACWSFYPAIRPFKLGVFKLAIETDTPVLPMVVKYRRPKGLYRLFKKHPNATLIIGAPLLPNHDLPIRESISDLAKRTRASMLSMLGLSEEENEYVRSRLKTYHIEKKTIF